MDETWDLTFPEAGATGLPFARARVAAEQVTGRLLVHAAPPVLDVVVRDDKGVVTARGEGLRRSAPGPMVALLRDGDRVLLEDGWPTQDDVGTVVLLPGGEAGVLTAWWHADDKSSWRWQVEFSNHV